MKNRLATVSIGSLLALCALSVSCATEAPEPLTVLHNEAVDAKTRAQIQLLNTRLVNGFLEDDQAALRELFVDDVLAEIESGPGLDPVFASIRGVLTETTVVPFYEFDITLREASVEALEIPAEGDRGFSLSLQPTGLRMHVSLLEARAGFRDHLMGLIYIQDDDAWRLQALRVGALRVDGKNALEWYAEALRLSEQELYVPAAMRLMVAGDLLRPLPFMRFNNASVVLELEQRVSRALAEAHSFPLELPALRGTPSVIRLEPVFQRRQLLTLISYVTQQGLNQAAVDAEVLRVHEALTGIFPGLCHDSPRVAYKAFAEAPLDPQKAYDYINAVAPCAPPPAG